MPLRCFSLRITPLRCLITLLGIYILDSKLSKLTRMTCSWVDVKREVLSNELTHTNLAVTRPLVGSLTTWDYGPCF